ncbi:MAG TPA: hypothetical protein VGH29_19380, partial [Candidatus Binataceae bacterium]
MSPNHYCNEPFVGRGLSEAHEKGSTEWSGTGRRVRAGGLLSIGTFAALLCMLLSQPASGQELPHFDASVYSGLADVSSSATIPPGTRITLANWQQYKQFMPLGLQELYSQKFFWKVSNTPDFVVEVAPTTAIPT